MVEPYLRRSPLAHLGLAARAAAARAGAGIVLGERAHRCQIDLRGDAADPALAQAVAEAAGLTLPIEPNTVAEAGALAALWLGPDERLIVGSPRPRPAPPRPARQGHAPGPAPARLRPAGLRPDRPGQGQRHPAPDRRPSDLRNLPAEELRRPCVDMARGSGGRIRRRGRRRLMPVFAPRTEGRATRWAAKATAS